MPSLALGIDVVEIERVQRVLQRHPQRFLRRVHTPDEAAFCRGRGTGKDCTVHLDGHSISTPPHAPLWGYGILLDEYS